MSDDYLWDGQGEPDAELAALEEALGELRYDRKAPRVPERAAADAQVRPAGHEGPGGRPRRTGVLLALVAALLIAVIGAVVIALVGIDDDPGPTLDPTPPIIADTNAGGWYMRPMAGLISCDDNTVTEPAKLAVGQWLETETDSRARLSVADIGVMDIRESTRLRIVKTSPDEHRIELAKGSVRASVVAPPRLFVVETPAARAVDLGCEYELTVDESGDSHLVVYTGYVSMENDQGEVYVPAGAEVRVRRGHDPDIPHFQDASAAFVAAVGSLSSAGNDLDTVLAEARPRDTLSLWHAVPRVTKDDRGRIYDRASELAPEETSMVERQGIVDAEPEALDAWQTALDRIW